MCNCEVKCDFCVCAKEECKVFVYGTLREGGALHGNLAEFVSTKQDDKVIGKLSHVQGAWFPVFTHDGETEVIGEVYTVPKEVINMLDMVEGVPYLYDRETITTLSGDDVYIYVGVEATPDVEIVSGDFFNPNAE
jgi:gamma-glutamylcyclotransferase (GGCT)/AIG2-like uncharacterized protein YtfP